MEAAESIFIRECQRRFNAAILSGQSKDSVDALAIEDAVIRDGQIIPASLRDEILAGLTETVRERKEAEQKLFNDLSLAWGPAFDAVDQCITFADYLNCRFKKTCGTKIESLMARDPRPRRDRITGAVLKCLVLISLHARSCCTALEILCLLRKGFQDGAESRLRTLHEQLVVITLLGNDHTYELAERYQDHAVFEALKQLRAAKRAFAQPMWRESPGRDDMISREIRDAERDAREARIRWGAEISEHYEWARPVLSKTGNPKRRINFTELEEAAGADFLRADYLTQNDHVHAGAFGTINHPLQAELTACGLRDDEAIHIAGWRVTMLLEFASQIVSKSISWETGEYDEFLYACEMTRTASKAEEKLDECYAEVSQAAR